MSEELRPTRRKPGPKPTEMAERFWAKAKPAVSGDCLEWNGWRNKHGYGGFTVWSRLPNGQRRKVNEGAHRLAWRLTHGEIPDGIDVCHRCDNPCCVNPAHLFLGTRHDNMRDCAAKGRSARGSRHGQSVLTDEEVREIHRLASSGAWALAEIAARYEVSPSVVTGIIQGRTWAHLALPATPSEMLGVRISDSTHEKLVRLRDLTGETFADIIDSCVDAGLERVLRETTPNDGDVQP